MRDGITCISTAIAVSATGAIGDQMRVVSRGGVITPAYLPNGLDIDRRSIAIGCLNSA